MDTAELHSITSASKDPVTAGLVNAILTDNHKAARMFQDIIHARSNIQAKNMDGKMLEAAEPTRHFAHAPAPDKGGRSV